MLKTYSKLLRIEQWYKNLIVFTPLLFSQNTHFLHVLPIAFLGFACLSSITYLFNDWMDREKDRLHPIKKERPLAAGKVSGKAALITAFFLAGVVGVAVGVLGTFYGSILLAYFVLTNAYSLGLKNIPLLDIMMIATNFALRMAAGMAIFPGSTDLPYFGLLFGLILVLSSHKRSSDLKMLGAKAIGHKPVLKYYTPGYNYIYRSIGYLIVFIAFFYLWQNGWATHEAIGWYLQILLTSHTLSKHPEYTSKPQKLFSHWLWLGLLVMNGGLSFLF